MVSGLRNSLIVSAPRIMVTLDFQTIGFAAVVLATLMGALLLLAWAYVRSETCLIFWGVTDLFCAGSVAVLTAANGRLGPNVAPFSNGWLLTGAALTYCGMRAFDRRPITLPIWLAVIATPLSYYIACVLFLPNVNDRVVLYTFICCCWLGGSAYVLAHVPSYAPAFSRMLVALFLAGMCTIQVVRLAGSLAGFRPLGGDMTSEQMAWTFAAGLFFTVGLNFGGMFMVLDRMASCDELTELSNRRSLLMGASALLRSALASGRPVSVLLVDLDHFKSINDRFGHRTGDQVLRAFAQVARKLLRRGDLVGRYGGEEFCLVLKDAGSDVASVMAERLRRQVMDDLREVEGHAVEATVAIGVASLEAGQRVAGIDRMIDAADHALYAAKDGGRNRVVLAAPLVTPQPAAPHAGGAAASTGVA